MPASDNGSLPECDGMDAETGSKVTQVWRIMKRAVLALAILVAVVGMGSVLIASAAPKVGQHVLSMKSGSMSPAINPGDLIVVHQVDATSIRPGDIITFRRPQGTAEVFTHRVVSIDDGPAGVQFHTKGDANPVPDAWAVSSAGPAFRVEHVVRHGGVFLLLVQSHTVRLAVALSVFFLVIALLWPVIVSPPRQIAELGAA